MEADGPRIIVVGTTGSGKTTLARALATAYRIPHTSLDDLHHRPGWQVASDNEFIESVSRVIETNQWAMDGNYSKVRDMIWERATHIIWVDLPFWLNFRQLMKRIWLDWRSKRPICNGNVQSLGAVFRGREGLFWWFLTTYHRRRRRYPEMFADRRWEGKQFTRLTSRRAIAEFASEHGATLVTD